MRALVWITIASTCLALAGCGSNLMGHDAGTGGVPGTGGFGTGGIPGTGGVAGNFPGTGGVPGAQVWDASVDAVGGLACPALTAPASTTPAAPPAAGCPCTRALGHGNSYLCPMGIGQTFATYIGPDGGTLSILGQQGAMTNVPFGIVIPAGALTSTTLVSVTETDLPPPSGVQDWSPVYLLEPRGLQLARVAKLQIPWSSNLSMAPKTLAIYERDENGSCGFAPLVDSHINAGFEQASLTEFGYLLVGAPATVDPATCTGPVDAAADPMATADAAARD